MSKNRKIWEFFYPIFTYISLICFSLCISLLSVDTGLTGWLGIPTWVEWPLLMWIFASAATALWAKVMSELHLNEAGKEKPQYLTPRHKKTTF